MSSFRPRGSPPRAEVERQGVWCVDPGCPRAGHAHAHVRTHEPYVDAEQVERDLRTGVFRDDGDHWTRTRNWKAMRLAMAHSEPVPEPDYEGAETFPKITAKYSRSRPPKKVE